MTALVLSAATSEAATPVLGPERVVVENAQRFEMATTGDAHLATWTDASGFARAQILRASTGEPVTGVIEIAGPAVSEIAVAGNVNGFLVVWTQGAAWGEVRATRVSAAGEVLDPGGILIRDDVGEEHGTPITVRHMSPVVIWSGSHWLVGASSSITEYWQSWSQPITTSGGLGARRIWGRGRIWLAMNGSTLLAVTTDPDSEGRAMILLLKADGTGGSSYRLSDTVRAQGGIGALSRIGSGFAISFLGDADYGQDHGGTWLSLVDGATGDPVRTRSFAAPPTTSALAVQGGNLVIGWDEGIEARLLRVNPFLEPIDRAAGHPIFRHAVFRTLVVGNDRIFVIARRGSSLVGRTVSY